MQKQIHAQNNTFNTYLIHFTFFLKILFYRLIFARKLLIFSCFMKTIYYIYMYLYSSGATVSRFSLTLKQPLKKKLID